MRHAIPLTALSLSVLLALGDALAEDAAGAELVVSDHIGRLFVETAANIAAIEVKVDPGEEVIRAPGITVQGRTTRVEGDGARSQGCRSKNGLVSVKHDGEWKPIEAFPTVRVKAPLTARIVVGDGLVVGEIGDVGEAELVLNGCGDLRVGAVTGDAVLKVNGSGDLVAGAIGGALEAAVNGSGDLKAGDTGAARASVNGSGDLELGAVNGGLETAVNGSGDLKARSIDGALLARVAGSGDIRIEAGRAPSVEASVVGSGDVRFDGEAGDVVARVVGSGDIVIGSATGSIDVADRSSGSVRIGDR